MLSKKLYINILARVSVIVFLSILLGFLIFRESSVRLSVICAIIILIFTINLIAFLNRTNRNIRFFFDSVRNDDSNLSFSLDNKSGTLKELHRSMNTVNKQIQNLKIENLQQEQFFQKILELLATAIITFDKKGFIHHANSAALKLLSADILTHISQLERIDKKLFTIVSTLKPYEKHLLTTNTGHGEINLLLKSTSSGSGDNELIILSIQDIKNELDEKEIDAWMKLIRVLMHEIMNSITPITSLSESLQKRYKPDERQISPEELTAPDIEVTLRGLQAISEQGLGLMHFVESFRKLSNIPRPEMKLFSVSHLTDRVAALSDSLKNGANVQIDFICQRPDIEILADENLISQVLINLIKNAIEANEQNPACQIIVRAGVSEDNTMEICVSDNGPGITKENIENIFVPFFTTREKGSGIGLSLSRQIMWMHGGTITVRSEQGRETIFCLRFRRRP